MKRAIDWAVVCGVIACLALAVWPWLAGAQTTVPVEVLRARGNGQLLGIVGNRITLVGLRGLTIEGGELRLIEAGRPIQLRRVVYRVSDRVAEFPLPTLASGTVLVYRNGLLMTPPEDYELDGGVVRFRPDQVPVAGDIVNILYEGMP